MVAPFWALPLADKLTEEAKQAQFLTLVSDGMTVTKARQAVDISAFILKRWKQTQSFADALRDAQEAAVENDFDRLAASLEIYPNPQQAKVFSDNIKWRLSKIDPSRFGDAINLKTTVSIDISDRFKAALDRLSLDALRHRRDTAQTIDGQSVRIAPSVSVSASDNQSETASARLGQADADTLTGKAETRADAEGGVRVAGAKARGSGEVLPPLQTDRDEVKSKDYAIGN